MHLYVVPNLAIRLLHSLANLDQPRKNGRPDPVEFSTFALQASLYELDLPRIKCAPQLWDKRTIESISRA